MKKVYSFVTKTGNLFTATIRIALLPFGLAVGAMAQNTLIQSSGSNTMNYYGSLCTHAGCQVTYANYVNGYTVLNASGFYIIHIIGSYATE